MSLFPLVLGLDILQPQLSSSLTIMLLSSLSVVAIAASLAREKMEDTEGATEQG